MSNPTISFVLPCYGRPERTRRMLECIGSQSISNWEGFIYGDYCHDFTLLLESDWYQSWVKDQTEKGNIIYTGNMPENGGGHGYAIINNAIQAATGSYFLFLSNDDTISPNHFEHYLTGIRELDRVHEIEYDFVFFNTAVPANNGTRISNLTYGGCGHAELIIRTEFLKRVQPHGSEYGHDWHLIQNMLNMPLCRFRKALSQDCTYNIHSIPGKTSDTIN